MDELREWTYRVLPEGCPFVIGGGMIRDAILGGRPSDIDIWLPSNLGRDYLTAGGFIDKFLEHNPESEAECSILFELGVPRENIDAAGYGDVNNHWVVEVQIPNWPRINFMCSLAEWRTEDPQYFFNGVMRGFDIDQCMFFIGWMPNQRDVNTVILPQHLMQRHPRNFNLNELYWNQYRLENTSAARVEARLIKMYSKYGWNMRTPEELNAHGFILPTNQIVAKPFLLRDVLRHFERQGICPMYQNSVHYDETAWTGHMVATNRRYTMAKDRVATQAFIQNSVAAGIAQINRVVGFGG